MFDEIVLRRAVRAPQVTVVINEQNPSTLSYIVYHDGFYYTLRKGGARKVFSNPNVEVVRAVAVVESVQ